MDVGYDSFVISTVYRGRKVYLHLRLQTLEICQGKVNLTYKIWLYVIWLCGPSTHKVFRGTPERLRTYLRRKQTNTKETIKKNYFQKGNMNSETSEKEKGGDLFSSEIRSTSLIMNTGLSIIPTTMVHQ